MHCGLPSINKPRSPSYNDPKGYKVDGFPVDARRGWVMDFNDLDSTEFVLDGEGKVRVGLGRHFTQTSRETGKIFCFLNSESSNALLVEEGRSGVWPLVSRKWRLDNATWKLEEWNEDVALGIALYRWNHFIMCHQLLVILTTSSLFFFCLFKLELEQE
jgi:hypothetical protein